MNELQQVKKVLLQTQRELHNTRKWLAERELIIIDLAERDLDKEIAEVQNDG